MRTVFAGYAALVCACSTRQQLAPATQLSANVVAVDSVAGQLYWVQLGDQATVHGPAGLLWQAPSFGRRSYSVVAGDAGVIVSNFDAFESCGETLWIHVDGTFEMLPLLAGGACNVRAIDQAFGGLLYEVNEPAQGMRVVQRFDLATRAIVQAFELGSGTVWPVDRGDSEAFGLVTSTTGDYVAAFRRDRPTSLRVVARGVWSPAGLAVLDDDVFWLDNGYTQEGATLLRAPTAGVESDATPVAIVDSGYAWSLAAVQGSLWVAPHATNELLRVEPSGAVQRFEVPYTAHALLALGDELVIRTSEAGQSRLLLQPID